MNHSRCIAGGLALLLLFAGFTSSAVLRAESQGETQAESAKAIDYYGQGVHAFFGGDGARAVPLLEKAIELDAQDPRPWFYVGLCALRTGSPEEANRCFRTGADLEQKPSATLYDVPSALSRIQGPERLVLEQQRIAARLRWEKMEKRRLQKRYGEIRQATHQMMQEQIEAAEEVSESPEAEQSEEVVLRAPFGARPIQPFEEPEFVETEKKQPEIEMTEEEMMEGVVLDPVQTAEEESEPEPVTQEPAPEVTETTNPFEMGAAAPADEGGENPFGESAPQAQENPFGESAPAQPRQSPGEASPFGENAGPTPIGGGTMNFFTQPGQMIQKPSQQIGGLIGSGVARLIRGKSEDSEPTATDENPFGESTSETEEAAPEDTPAADENPFGENSAAPEATDEPPADENPFGESTSETEEAAPEDAPAAETNPFE